MNFFVIIFYIIVIAVIVNAKKSASSNAGKGNKRGPSTASAKGAVRKYKPTAIPNVPAKRKTATPNVPGKVSKNIFQELQMEDEHRENRHNNLWKEDVHEAERIVALRLMEGDPVPEGYLRIRCPYCAADNLVTKHDKRYHSCYFCRVPID